MIAHRFVFPLGVELIAWDTTSNPFFGLCFLVGLGRGVVLPRRRLGRRNHDHSGPLGGLGLFDGLLNSILLALGEVADHFVGSAGLLGGLGVRRGRRWFYGLALLGEARGGMAHRDEHEEGVTNEAGKCHLPACYEPNVSAW